VIFITDYTIRRSKRLGIAWSNIPEYPAEDAEAIETYEEFGRHLGGAIKLILYVLNTECIVIGGGAKAAFPLYSKSMWDTIRGFAYKRAVSALNIEISSLLNANILGAAALHFTTN
jgi:glucokinase